MKIDLSGKISQLFIQAKLTPLLLLMVLLIGIQALIQLPREEEPQISVPMVDIFVEANGLKAIDAIELVTKPLEDIIQGISGVEHTYSFTDDNKVLVTARFFVGTDEDRAILRVHEEIRAHLAEIPFGINMPLIVGRGINDVPVLVLNISPKEDYSDRWSDNTIYHIAEELLHELHKIDDVGLSFLVGGHPTQIRIEPDPELLRLYNVSLSQLVDKLKQANYTQENQPIRHDGAMVSVVTGDTLQTIEEIENLIINTQDNRQVYVSDVATVKMTVKEDEKQVWGYRQGEKTLKPSVSIAVAKRKSANAVTVVEDVMARVESLKNDLLPNTLDIEVIRNYGETAQEKSNNLLFSLFAATAVIVLLVSLMVGWREGITVLIIIPTTILLTLAWSWMLGFTINRVSLFALIFSIGILVDDAIVITDNIKRHWQKGEGKLVSEAIAAIQEVGNPTIMANLTILAALLPMLFVSGLMGPYMSPIPVNASAAVILSLVIALVFAPWLLLKLSKNRKVYEINARDRLTDAFLFFVRPIIHRKAIAFGFLLSVTLVTVLLLGLFINKSVSVKMLPFDNKPELQVLLDLPMDSTKEDTERLLRAFFHQLKDKEEIESIWLYSGTASPFNFNGLARHYYLRNLPYQGELFLKLKNQKERTASSHEIAMNIRTLLDKVTIPEGATLKVVEVPPGPPVLSTLLAEIYGEDHQERRQIALSLQEIFKEIPFIVDTDVSFKNPVKKIRLDVDHTQVEFFGVDEEDIFQTVQALYNPVEIGYSHRGKGVQPVEITLVLPKNQQVLNESILSTPIESRQGTIELGDVISIQEEQTEHRLYRRNGRFVEMVQAELAGDFEAPIYGMLAVNEKIASHPQQNIRDLKIRYKEQPDIEKGYHLLWDGEWEITYVTFRDLGLAFCGAVILIYLLLVGQTKSFRLPLLILSPIPLTMSGIVIGHWLLDAHFTATSMIGFIALSGIIIRNSLLLIEFVQASLKTGNDLKDALNSAVQSRFRPIFLTAITAMVGAAFMLPDPIFEGLGISLLFGLASSTFLTLLVIPACYILMGQRE